MGREDGVGAAVGDADPILRSLVSSSPDEKRRGRRTSVARAHHSRLRTSRSIRPLIPTSLNGSVPLFLRRFSQSASEAKRWILRC
mgnify:CR=1 FL=1